MTGQIIADPSSRLLRDAGGSSRPDTSRMKIGRERHADPILEVTDVARAKRRTQGPVKVACIALCKFQARAGFSAGPVCESAEKRPDEFFKFGSCGFDHAHGRD